ncbi:DUF2637 domain-containing protein [Mycobacterium sp. ENV421]|uniref:DUF2637 domain-containing protein n=1 Tax=Mycobacterium sp. ENV421 TaxID=1213407 RepID=UPI001E2FB8D6|nr:DUF2637 domain-containing protein [Mycobacterium sp. ENV421]
MFDSGDGEAVFADPRAVVWASRAVAVAINAAILIASIILSFSSLSDLARRTGSWTGWLPYLWPGIVDGSIVLATVGLLTTRARPDQRRNRQFFWIMLVTGTLVSIGGNAVHAILPTNAPLPPALSFAMACVPPVAILASTHAVQIFWQLNTSRRSASPRVARTGESPVQVNQDRGQPWLALAREIHQRGRLTNHSETTLSQALWRLFEVRPQMSLRAIGEEVGVGHHDVIARIRQTATEVVRERPELGRVR